MEPKTPGEHIVRAKLLHKTLTEFGACCVRLCLGVGWGWGWGAVDTNA